MGIYIYIYISISAILIIRVTLQTYKDILI